MPVRIEEAEVSELQGKGIDVLARDVIERSPVRSASNDPADAEAAVKAKADADAKAKADSDAAAKKAEGEKKGDDGGVQKRIDELTRKQRTAEREAQAERAARIKAEQERDAARESATKNAPKPEAPKREDFEDQDAYVAARVAFEVKQALDERDADAAAKAKERDAKRGTEEATRNAEEEARQIGERFAQQQVEARKKYEDFDTVTGSESVMLKPSLAAAIVCSDAGAELQYHFGMHPEVVERLNGLDQASMLKELGKIELSLTAEPKRAEPAGDGAGDQPRDADGKFVSAKEVSSAKEPINPVNGSAEGSSSTKDPERMSVAEHRLAAYRAGSR